jgi:hypothetical protein
MRDESWFRERVFLLDMFFLSLDIFCSSMFFSSDHANQPCPLISFRLVCFCVMCLVDMTVGHGAAAVQSAVKSVEREKERAKDER